MAPPCARGPRPGGAVRALSGATLLLRACRPLLQVLALARVTGRRPEAALTSSAFDALLPTLVLGSRETAAAVARIVVAYLGAGPAVVPYLPDLLRYEEAMMVVEAGSRVWRDGGNGDD